MPHYKDGTPAKVGDVVVGPHEKRTLVGVVHQIMSGSDTCNMLVGNATAVLEADGNRVVMPLPASNTYYATCKEFAKVALWLLCLGVLCALCGETWAQQRSTYGQYYQPPAAVNRLDQKVDGHTQYNIGRSSEPPTAEAEKLFLTIITSDAWQSNERERQIVSWFNNDPRLVKLRGNTRWNWYTVSNPHYKDRLRYKYGEGVPIVNVSRPDGEAVLHVTALSMPRTSGELADMADDAINAKYAAPSSGRNSSGAGGSPWQSPIVEDCPNCPDDKPPSPDGGPVLEPIDEVLPPAGGGWLPVLAVFAAIFGFLFILGSIAVVAVVALWPRNKRTQLVP